MKKIFFITTWMMLLLIQTRFVMAEDTMPPTPATPVATQLEEEKPSKTPEELKADLINKTQNTPDKTFLVKGDNKFVNLEREEERFLRDQDKVLVAQNINKELEEKLNEMKEIKNQLSKDVNKRVSVNDHIKQLVTLYESISAEQATQIIKQLPSALSVSILSMMNPKKSSKILAAMEPHMAADMSKKILKEPQKLALGRYTMSFGRIESGGNQVKDSMTQLTELTQNQQSNFHETLNETCKQEDKKTSDTQSTQEASQTNQTNTQKDQDQVQAVKSDSSKQDSQESKDQEDADNSVQETKNEDSQSLKKQDEEVLLDEEQTINQSDMLLLSLLIQPQIQQTPTTQTPQTQEVMTAMTEDTDTSQAENSAMFIQINTNLKSSDEQNLEIKDPKTEENTSTLESSLLPQEQQLANNTAKLENTTPTIKSPAPSLKKEEEDDTPVQSKQETSTINKTPFQQIKVENKNTMKQTTNFSSDTTPTDDTQETKKRSLKIDDLIFELRHPELVMAQKEGSIKKVEQNIKVDLLATDTLEKSRSIQNQVLSALRTIIDRREEKMIVHLDPPEWGKIDVQMKLNNKEFNVQIKTEHLFVKESLEKGIPELKQAFSGQGLQLGQLHVGVGSQMAQERKDQEDSDSPSKVSGIKKDEKFKQPELAGETLDLPWSIG